MKKKAPAILITCMFLLMTLGISASGVKTVNNKNFLLQQLGDERKLIIKLDYMNVLDDVDIGSKADLYWRIKALGCTDDNGEETWFQRFPKDKDDYVLDNEVKDYQHVWSVEDAKSWVSIEIELWDDDSKDLIPNEDDLLDLHGGCKYTKKVSLNYNLNTDTFEFWDTNGEVVYPPRVVGFDGSKDGTENSNDKDVELKLEIFDNDDTFIPNIVCEGNLDFSKVEPGNVLTGSFTVKNEGEPYSQLHWLINNWPKNWGEWVFDPVEGDLYAGHQTDRVDFTLTLSDEKTSYPSGKIEIWGYWPDGSETTSIDISIEYKSRAKNIANPLLSEIMEMMFDRFPLLQRLLNL